MSALLEPLGLTLLHSLWQFTLFALLLSLFLRGLPESRARYRAACLTLALLPVLFALTLLTVRTPNASPVVSPLAGFTLSYSTVGAEAVFANLRLEHLSPYLAGAWMIGVALNALGVLGGWFYLARLRRTASDICPTWQERTARLSKDLGLRLQVQTFASPLVSVPTVIGLFKPLILLPTSVLSGLSPAQLEAILVHELLHIRRYDAFVNTAQTLIESLFFYHPAVHWVSRLVRQEREHCCDDAAVAFTGDAHAYAHALVRLETLRPLHPQLSLAATGGHLMKRVRRLVQPIRPAKPAPVRLLVLGVLVAGLLAACGSGTLRTNEVAAPLTEVEAFCFRSVSVRTGIHEMAAFNDASARAMKTALSRRGYDVSCNGNTSDLNLEYDMAFDAQSLTWQAVMRVSDAQGKLLYLASAKDAIDGNGAFQYTTESTAERLLGRILGN